MPAATAVVPEPPPSFADETLARVPLPPRGAPPWRRALAFFGPGLLVAVGYMDPGNWATDLAGGARFGYLLLAVIALSSLLAMVLQHLALKLGVATGQDLAQACRASYGRGTNFTLWVFCEIAIIACDLAEVIGAAVALNLLFRLPLFVGVLLTAADVLLLLLLQRRGFRWLEAVVGALIALIAGCFAYELIVSRPEWAGVFGGLIPRAEIVRNPEALFLAVGILGATVMPHNLYLHSSIVQTRAYERDPAGRRTAVRFATWDSNLALGFAFFVNAAILILSAAAFHRTGQHDVAEIADAHRLLAPTLGAPLAGVVFAVALLASGQNSTLTGTLAGQIVMEGFLNLRLRPWVRRLVTRAIAIVPAAFVAATAGEQGVGQLLLLSQVVLSLQLSFAVVPLVMFTSDRRKMGEFVNGPWLKGFAWSAAALIAGLNLFYLWRQVAGGS